MEEILKITFSGFWSFVGMTILLYGLFYFIVNGAMRVWARFMRMLMVRKHGWPPSHLDADGDFKA